MPSRRFPSPWSVEEQSACYVVRDHNGQQLAYSLFRGGAGPAISGQATYERRSAKDRSQYREAAGFTCSAAEPGDILKRPTDLTLAPLCRSRTFRKYDSTCVAVVSAQLWNRANRGSSSGEAHRLAARKTDMARLSGFVIH
jgi:hypothetical protein